MVFLEGNHSEPEIVSEKVLQSVTLGEPNIQALTSYLVGAFSFM
jgi:hypothetical protein